MSTLKLFFALTIGLVCVLASEAVLPQNKNVSDWENKWRRIHQSRPHRLEGPLRYDNISDIEVREIEKEVREIMPGAIVNISGVTTGCPCEDGPKCTDQVWIVAYRPERSTGLMLSKIDGHWRVGPVQKHTKNRGCRTSAPWKRRLMQLTRKCRRDRFSGGSGLLRVGI